MNKENRLNIISVVIAICAVFLTLFQAHSTNYHNRISSLPLVQTGVDVFEDGKITLYFENAGNGPAIVTDFEVAGKKAGSVRPIVSEFIKVNNLDAKEFELLTTEFPDRLIIKAGSKLEVATFYPKDKDSESYEAVSFIVNQLPVTLCYISLYQDELYVTSNQDFVLEDSCAYDGATKILGKWIKFRMPFSTSVEQSKIFAN
ncbi:TPA: hypothetical protein ACMDSY_004530 [Vibrio parahaemolyticus]|nr:hypothetical protein [Vibrio parahaemolyticus]